MTAFTFIRFWVVILAVGCNIQPVHVQKGAVVSSREKYITLDGDTAYIDRKHGNLIRYRVLHNGDTSTYYATGDSDFIKKLK